LEEVGAADVFFSLLLQSYPLHEKSPFLIILLYDHFEQQYNFPRHITISYSFSLFFVEKEA
jgi:hypothetical protein